MSRARLLVVVAAALACCSMPARAQASMAGHMDPAHDNGAAPTSATPPQDHREMVDAMTRMDQAMMAPQAVTGDPDHDLVAMMIPHHQGAIDMARIYLRSGRDPQIRRMAQKIIVDQEREIREMRDWQARHPLPAR